MTTETVVVRPRQDALIGWFRAWLTRQRARKSQRAAICYLESMPDHSLRDIGLTRSGIRRAVRHGRCW